MTLEHPISAFTPTTAARGFQYCDTLGSAIPVKNNCAKGVLFVSGKTSPLPSGGWTPPEKPAAVAGGSNLLWWTVGIAAMAGLVWYGSKGGMLAANPGVDEDAIWDRAYRQARDSGASTRDAEEFANEQVEADRAARFNAGDSYGNPRDDVKIEDVKVGDTFDYFGDTLIVKRVNKKTREVWFDAFKEGRSGRDAFGKPYSPDVKVFHIRDFYQLKRVQRANPGRAQKEHFTRADADPEQLRLGIKHELEHTDSRKVAERIALDHLAEDPAYYDHLDAMERSLKSNPDSSAPYTLEDVNTLTGTRTHRKATKYETLNDAMQQARKKASSIRKFAEVNILDRSGNPIMTFEGEK